MVCVYALLIICACVDDICTWVCSYMYIDGMCLMICLSGCADKLFCDCIRR